MSPVVERPSGIAIFLEVQFLGTVESMGWWILEGIYLAMINSNIIYRDLSNASLIDYCHMRE